MNLLASTSWAMMRMQASISGLTAAGSGVRRLVDIWTPFQGPRPRWHVLIWGTLVNDELSSGLFRLEENGEVDQDGFAPNAMEQPGMFAEPEAS